MSMSFWKFYHRGRGTITITQTFPPGNVDTSSHVVASICELTPLPFGNEVPHLGDANMQILNVAPTGIDTVKTRVRIDWHEELPFQIVYHIETPQR